MKKVNILVTSFVIILSTTNFLTESSSAYSDTIFWVQKRLKMLGYDPGQIDGLWGKKTQRAIEKFQRKNSLPVTGEIDEQTKDKLVSLTPTISSKKKSIDDALEEYKDLEFHILSYSPSNFQFSAMSKSGEFIIGMSMASISIGTNMPKGGVSTGPFRYSSKDGMLSIGTTPGGGTPMIPKVISSDCSIIVGMCGAKIDNEWGGQSCLWKKDERVKLLGKTRFEAFAMTADGNTIVGKAKFQNEYYPARWTVSEGLEKVEISKRAGVLKAISDDGKILAGETKGKYGQAFRWTMEEGFKILFDSPPIPSFSVVQAMSSDGSVVSGNAYFYKQENVLQAFRWSATSGLKLLGGLPSGSSESYIDGMSDDGSFIIGFSKKSESMGREGMRAFIWNTKIGMQDLMSLLTKVANIDLGSWNLYRGACISGDGKIIMGLASNPKSDERYWILEIP
jgi:uncharacterized membrane protein